MLPGVTLEIFMSTNFSESPGQFSFTVQDLNIQFVTDNITLNWTVFLELGKNLNLKIWVTWQTGDPNCFGMNLLVGLK